MPLYEYECEDGHRFERIQKFSDPPVESCQVCQKPVRKLLSSPAIQFKGSGWYITDYAKKGGNVDSAGSKTAAGDKKAEGSTASESTAEKPAAKPADKPPSAT
jgi:putative FmdB family regulatory protein